MTVAVVSDSTKAQFCHFSRPTTVNNAQEKTDTGAPFKDNKARFLYSIQTMTTVIAM
jgi:hypothetical protein